MPCYNNRDKHGSSWSLLRYKKLSRICHRSETSPSGLGFRSVTDSLEFLVSQQRPWRTSVYPLSRKARTPPLCWQLFQFRNTSKSRIFFHQRTGAQTRSGQIHTTVSVEHHSLWLLGFELRKPCKYFPHVQARCHFQIFSCLFCVSAVIVTSAMHVQVMATYCWTRAKSSLIHSSIFKGGGRN